MRVFLVYHYSSVNVEYYNDMPEVVGPWKQVYKAGDKTFYVLCLSVRRKCGEGNQEAGNVAAAE